jgi:hypothetical protein
MSSKELCYILLDFDTEMKVASESTGEAKAHESPDGDSIAVGSERAWGAEVILQPSFFGKEASDIHVTSSQSMKKWDVDIEEELTAPAPSKTKGHDHGVWCLTGITRERGGGALHAAGHPSIGYGVQEPHFYWIRQAGRVRRTVLWSGQPGQKTGGPLRVSSVSGSGYGGVGD